MKRFVVVGTLFSVLVLIFGTCYLSCSSSKTAGKSNGGDGNDGGSTNCSDALMCGDSCCQEGQICLQDTCVSRSTCTTDNDCQNDTYCDTDGKCTSYDTGTRGSSNPNCTRLVVAGIFQPALQCQWTDPPAGDPYPSHVQVLASPMVADFDFDSDPTTIHPSMVFNTYDALDGASGDQTANSGVLRIIDGSDCRLLYTIHPQNVAGITGLNGSDPVAIGDLDGDGRPEIVAHSIDNTTLSDIKQGVVAYKYDPINNTWVLFWQGHDINQNPVMFDRNGGEAWGGPSIIDLDNDGKPEILSGGVVYDSTGLLLDSSLGFYGIYHAGFPVAADLDGDGLIEMVNGDKLWKFDPTRKQWVQQTYSGTQAGYTAVADFGTYGANSANDNRAVLDGIPEIVVVSGGHIWIYTLSGRQIFYGTLPNSTGGGPPTIGDFDGDGLAEVAAAGSDSMTVFDPDCQGTPQSTTCPSLRTDGILWSQPSQDHSSNRTGSSLFDFDGDGKVEVVYADEVFARVYRGTDGTVLFSQWRSSCTWNEYPIIADVDGDYAAELVVPSNEACSIQPASTFGNNQTYPTSPNGHPMDPLFAGLPCKTGDDCISGSCDEGLCRCTEDNQCADSGSGFVCAPPPTGTSGTGNTCRAEWPGRIHGVRVYHDSLDRWVGSRYIWNQHAYSITNVNEDGTIPKTSDAQKNWQVAGLNNFRQNIQGDLHPDHVPDMTTGLGSYDHDCINGTMILHTRICNRGTGSIAAGVDVGFFVGKPDSNSVSVCNPEAVTTQNLDVGECGVVDCTWPLAITNPGDMTVVVDYKNQHSECLKGNNQGIIINPHCQPL